MNKAKNTPHSWSEDRFQQECFVWFWNAYPQYRGLLFSVPNGMFFGKDVDSGVRKAYGLKMKLTGLTKGVSDLIFLFNKRAYLLELKKPDGSNGQSPEQKKWQNIVEKQGFTYLILNDLEEFKNFINLAIQTL